jgi:NAD(P)-dependent dehydrogenase (short-subunit alcohol dehydrogenase family)
MGDARLHGGCSATCVKLPLEAFVDPDSSHRRDFVKTAAAGVLLLKPQTVFGSQANSAVELGLIGCGSRGNWIGAFFPEFAGARIVALADVIRERLDATQFSFNVDAARTYYGPQAYRELIESKVDAVAIETPPYFHPEQARAAVEAGKHVRNAMANSKDVVVTGVSTGIGWGTTKVLVSKGFRVFGSVRKQADADRLQREFGNGFVPLMMDITDADAVHQAAQKVGSMIGDRNLVGLVNNAGIVVSGPLLYLRPSEYRRQLDVNMISPLVVIQAFAPLLGTDKKRQGPAGRIVNISSTGAKVAIPLLGAYSSSKAGLEGMSDALRRELMLFGIDVVIIEPGTVNTAMYDKGEKEDLSEFKQTEYWEAVQNFQKFIVAEARTNGLSPERLGEAVHVALSTAKPKARYAVVPQRFKNWTLPRLLPVRMLDAQLAKLLGLTKPVAKKPASANATLSRVLTSTGQTIDFLLTAKRARAAARRFFQRGLANPGHSIPRVINVDKNRSYAAAVDELKKDGTIRRRCKLRQCQYLNNVVEQDHRNAKRRTWLAKGYGSVATAWRTLRGIEAMDMIRKGRVRRAGKGDVVAQVKFINKLFGIAA